MTKIYDLTLPISPELVVWPGDSPIQFSQPSQIAQGDISTVTRLDMSAHTGTHLDAPAHFIGGGPGVETLDLHKLVGPALVVEALTAVSITAELLENLNIPPETKRLLIKTSNSARWQAGETDFYEEFVAIAADGARWLVDFGIRLVGVDYLSVAPFDDPVPTHVTLLEAGVIPVEGLNLHGIAPGVYQLVCLPLKLVGSDGAPCRAILIEEDGLHG